MKIKKGALTAQQIIVVIFLVIGLVIVLFFYSIFNWNPIINKQTCHNSIVYRSSVNMGPIKTSKVIPLKCETEKICFSMSDNNCEAYEDLGDEVKITKVKLSSDPLEAKKQIKEGIANAMYDCQYTLGAGQLNFMPPSWTGKNYCLVCSSFALDKIAREKVEDISYGEMYQYMQEKKKPSGESYLEYIYPGWKDWKYSISLFEELKAKSSDEKIKNMNFKDWKIDSNYVGGYSIMSQMAYSGTLTSWISSGAAGTILFIGGSLLVTSGIGAPIGVGLLAGGALGTVSSGAVFYYSYPGSGYDYVPPAIIRNDISNLQNQQCSSSEFAP